MSRIGRMPIAVPAGVTVDIAELSKAQRVNLQEFYQRLWTLKKTAKKSSLQDLMI